MPSQKRSREAVDGTPEEPEHLRLLHSIRNMWQFANLAQWIYIFGKAAKIDEAMEDIEVCLMAGSDGRFRMPADCFASRISRPSV